MVERAVSQPLFVRCAFWMKLVAVMGCLSSAGCFSYVPAEVQAPPVGGDVRVHLSRQGLADLPEIPDEMGSVLTGTLLERDEQDVLLRVPLRVRSEALQPTTAVGRNVRVPISGIQRLETRMFSRTRTGLAVVGGLAIAAMVVFGFGGDDDIDSPPPPDPPAEEMIRIPFAPN